MIGETITGEMIDETDMMTGETITDKIMEGTTIGVTIEKTMDVIIMENRSIGIEV